MSSCATLSVLSATTGEFRTWHRLSAWKHSEGQVRGSRHVSSTRRRVCFRFGGPSVGVVALTTLISTYVRLAIMRFTFSTPSSRTPRAWRSGSDPPPPGMDALRTCRGGGCGGGAPRSPIAAEEPPARAGGSERAPGGVFSTTPSDALRCPCTRTARSSDRPARRGPPSRARARARREPDRTARAPARPDARSRRRPIPPGPNPRRDEASHPRARLGWPRPTPCAMREGRLFERGAERWRCF